MARNDTSKNGHGGKLGFEEEKMLRLSAKWREHRAEAAKLVAAIEANLKKLGYGK